MSDELIEALDSANAGRMPSPFGRMEIVVPGAPVSVQSNKAVRNAYLSGIKSQLARFQFLLTGQLILNITWLLSAKSRYETDAKADIDNCLKPIIDAFTGPDGLFVDDCQLQGLYICWRHSDSHGERLLFEFEFTADEYCDKDGLAFLRLERGLCVPVNLHWSPEIRDIWVSMLKKGELTKSVLEALDVGYLPLAGLIGGGQPYHVTRVQSFPLLEIGEYLTSGTAFREQKKV